MAFPEELLCTHDGSPPACDKREKLLDRVLKFLCPHMVRIVPKGGAFQTHVTGFFICSRVPKTPQRFNPHILDSLSIQQIAQGIPVEVRKFARTGKSPDVGNDLDLEFFQEVPKLFKRPV